MKFLFIEPFFGGSHGAFARGWQAHSRHDIVLMTLPDRFWKWRMRGAALQFLSQKVPWTRYDGIIATDMINLADLVAIGGGKLPPCLVYFHENQLTYPLLPGKQRDDGLGLINISTALAARRVVFNSRFQRREFLLGVHQLLERMPDGPSDWCRDAIAQKSLVLYPGCPFPASDIPAALPRLDPPLIIWNHRWEYDKNPQAFFKALKILQQKSIPFRLAVLGEAGVKTPVAFERARTIFARELVAFGYVPRQETYEQWLKQGAIVVSTADQENFGISVVEAVRQGCLPLVPHRLAYPEIIPERFHDRLIYKDYRCLPIMLERMLTEYHRYLWVRHALVREMAQYAWERVVPAYDRELDLLVAPPA